MYLLGSRMWVLGKKHGFINMTDLFAERYGSNLVCVLAMIISIGSLLPYIGLQVKGAGLTLQGVTNNVISFETGLLYITIVVLCYVIIGGFRSVVWTDVVQSVIMLVGMLGAMFLIADKVAGGLGGVIQKAAAIDPKLVSFPGPAGIWTPSMVLTTCMVVGIGRVRLAADLAADVCDEKPQDHKNAGLHLSPGGALRQSSADFHRPGGKGAVSRP